MCTPSAPRPILRAQAFAAILFDMDGVLVDSEPLHEEAQRIVAREYGLNVPESEFSRFKGWTEQRVYAWIADNYDTGGHSIEALVAAKHRAFASLSAQLRPMEGAIELVTKLSASGHALGLVTSATSADQERACNRFKLDRCFQTVVCGEDVSKPKPHPEPYRLTAARLNVDPARCLVIEDSRYGVLSALSAGCTVYAVSTTFASEHLSRLGAHAVFDSVVALGRFLP